MGFFVIRPVRKKWTSTHEISYVVSWNFEHLVKVKTRKSVNLVNILEGFKEIEIVSPQEL
jgi:hypothetical protein